MSKKCNKCGKIKPLEDFEKNGEIRRRYSCKECDLLRKTIGEKVYAQKLKLEVFTYYCKGTPKCVYPDCSIDDLDILVIDHINNDGAEHRRVLNGGVQGGGKRFYCWLRKNGFPEGFQVLCANHNMKKEIERVRKKGMEREKFLLTIPKDFDTIKVY